MESDVTQQPPLVDRLWVWAESHKKQLLVGSIVVVVLGLVIALYFTHQNQEQSNANDALSKLTSRAVMPSAAAPTADSLLKVASDFSGTDAAQRAMLLAGAALFADGKYDEARGQFQRLLQEHSDSPFTAQASLGVAATLDAQGKTQDAINAYRSVADRYQQNWNVGPQAKLALSRLLVAQGKLQEARENLMGLADPRSYPGEIANEAMMRLRELFNAHPELIPTNAAPAASSILERQRMAPSAPVPSAPVVTSTNRAPATPPMISTNRSPAIPPLVLPPATNKP